MSHSIHPLPHSYFLLFENKIKEIQEVNQLIGKSSTSTPTPAPSSDPKKYLDADDYIEPDESDGEAPEEPQNKTSTLDELLQAKAGLQDISNSFEKTKKKCAQQSENTINAALDVLLIDKPVEEQIKEKRRLQKIVHKRKRSQFLYETDKLMKNRLKKLQQDIHASTHLFSSENERDQSKRFDCLDNLIEKTEKLCKSTNKCGSPNIIFKPEMMSEMNHLFEEISNNRLTNKTIKKFSKKWRQSAESDLTQTHFTTHIKDLDTHEEQVNKITHDYHFKADKISCFLSIDQDDLKSLSSLAQKRVHQKILNIVLKVIPGSIEPESIEKIKVSEALINHEKKKKRRTELYIRSQFLKGKNIRQILEEHEPTEKDFFPILPKDAIRRKVKIAQKNWQSLIHSSPPPEENYLEECKIEEDAVVDTFPENNIEEEMTKKIEDDHLTHQEINSNQIEQNNPFPHFQKTVLNLNQKETNSLKLNLHERTTRWNKFDKRNEIPKYDPKYQRTSKAQFRELAIWHYQANFTFYLLPIPGFKELYTFPYQYEPQERKNIEKIGCLAALYNGEKTEKGCVFITWNSQTKIGFHAMFQTDLKQIHLPEQIAIAFDKLAPFTPHETDLWDSPSKIRVDFDTQGKTIKIIQNHTVLYLYRTPKMD